MPCYWDATHRFTALWILKFDKRTVWASDHTCYSLHVLSLTVSFSWYSVAGLLLQQIAACSILGAPTLFRLMSFFHFVVQDIRCEVHNNLTMVTAPMCVSEMRLYLVYQVSSWHHQKDASKFEGKKSRGSGVWCMAC